jgi:hypothetical protein
MNIELDADKAKSLFDDAKLDRIINAVGLPFNGHRDALRHDLLDRYRQYTIASGPGSSGVNKRQIDRLNSISTHAKKLVGLLRADDDDLGIIRATWPDHPDCPPYPLNALSFLVELIDRMPGLKVKPANLAEGAKKRLGMRGGPLEWLINSLLREVYEKHFEAKAGRSRTVHGDPTGPYFRFVRETLAEFKASCSDETIIRYIGKS